VGRLAQTLDGRIATRGGVSQWIGGAGDLRHTHRLRALCDAVVVGGGTVAAFLPARSSASFLSAALVTVSVAQPPERPNGPPDRGGPGEGAGGGREGRGGPGGPPSAERLVEHAMSFDADGEGKLDRSELMKFAEEMQRMRGGRGGPGGSRGGPEGRSGRGPEGSGGFGGPGGGPPGSSEDRERPARPRRPE
jgi:hypothetical protein